MAFPAADSRTTSAHIATLIRSFSLVPAPAVPAIVDCVLASSPSLSASHLFSSLLDALPDVLQDWWREEGSNSGSTRTKVVMSYANALFHLVENAEMGCDALELLVWRGVIPMLQATTPDDKELLGQIIEMLGEVVSSFKAWELMEETIVLSCLRSIGLCIGMVRSGEQAVFHWSKESPTHYQKYGLDASFSLPLPIACRTLASLMDAALREKFQRKAQGEEELELIVLRASVLCSSFPPTCHI